LREVFATKGHHVASNKIILEPDLAKVVLRKGWERDPTSSRLDAASCLRHSKRKRR